jgi:hypothetical protein
MKTEDIKDILLKLTEVADGYRHQIFELNMTVIQVNERLNAQEKEIIKLKDFIQVLTLDLRHLEKKFDAHLTIRHGLEEEN